MYGNNRNGTAYNGTNAGVVNNNSAYPSQSGQPQSQFQQTHLPTGNGANSFSNANNASSQQQQQQQQQRRMHPIRPLTIKQLTEAQSVGEGVLVVDGREVTQATVVGCIVDY